MASMTAVGLWIAGCNLEIGKVAQNSEDCTRLQVVVESRTEKPAASGG
jgi:hypothetical protein